MEEMRVDVSYRDEVMHRNVQKRASEGMEKVGGYTKEKNNVLMKEDSENGYTVRLYFAEGKGDNNMIEEVQKILIETYINNLISKGGR